MIGTSREYANDGKLLYTIDCDNGIWNIVNKNNFPFFDIQSKMKKKADSLIEKIYGEPFLRIHTIWNIYGSYIYNKNESGNWTDKFKNPPNKFLFRYHVKLDANHIYDDLIEFELDDTGTFIPNEYEQVYGFEEVDKNRFTSFQVSHDKALRLAKERGLAENDTTRAIGVLQWEGFKKPVLYNGHFRFYVIFKTQSIKNLDPEGRSKIIDKYDVYSFNPWSSEFIEKKKMQTIRGWEKNSGSTTGLIPDK